MGKVSGSSRDFPYTEVRTSVQMLDPMENDRVNKEIRCKQAEKILVQLEMEEVEHYIAEIENGEIREIFELSFLQGMKQEKVAEMVGYSRGRISQIIGAYLKD
jgi:DNA-directed RNA polymerase specialized sigma subunit